MIIKGQLQNVDEDVFFYKSQLEQSPIRSIRVISKKHISRLRFGELRP